MGQNERLESDGSKRQAADESGLQKQFLDLIQPLGSTSGRQSKGEIDLVQAQALTKDGGKKPQGDHKPGDGTALGRGASAASAKKESDFNVSINGVPRFLDSMDDPAVKVSKGKNSDRYPADLAHVVPAQDLDKYKQAFDLVRAYHERCQKEVAQPAKLELARALDKAERNMAPADLKQLERERLLYGKALEKQESHEIPEGDLALRSLVYYPDPERGKAMKDFDEKARSIALQTLEQARPRQEKIDSSSQFGSKLDEAMSLVETYSKLKEKKEAPTIEA